MSVYWGGGEGSILSILLLFSSYVCIFVVCVCVCVWDSAGAQYYQYCYCSQVILCIFVYRNTITSILLLYSVFSLSQLPIISFLLSSFSFLVASCCPCTPDFIGF